MSLLSDLASIRGTIRPVLDPGFVPGALWNKAFREACEAESRSEELVLALSRPDGTVFRHPTRVLPHAGERVAANFKYVERMLKFLLWNKGGSRVTIGGAPEIARMIEQAYSPTGRQAFDHETVAGKMFLEPLTVTSCPVAEVPAGRENELSLGRNLDGCRIGFDLGGSDRKSAAVVDGDVVFSEEIAWDPYFQKDPEYHYAGIRDSLERAAARLPQVDAIGGSAAGVYVDNEPRVASLFRGLSDADFNARIRPIFRNLAGEWKDVPFEVANDGEVAALAASMSLNDNAVLGLSMGTSQAAGYCDPAGHITTWLNELAFAPIDYRDDAPVDEWSGDAGCGVQYFSQQAVARLLPAAGIEVPPDTPFAEQLVTVQDLMERGDSRARQIYETIGVYFGYALAQYADFYEIRNLVLFGRVTSGDGGQLIIDTAEELLAAHFPELKEAVRITTPDEKLKRHGQAIAAASLPKLAN